MNRITTPVALEDQLCFQLYSTSRAVTAAYRHGLAELGLTYPQYVTMLAIWEHDGRTVSELCHALDLDSGTVSPLLARLVADGRIEKLREDGDGRSVRVFCTAAGAELEARVARVRVRVEAATGLSHEEFVQLRGMLQRVRSAVRHELQGGLEADDR